VHGRTLPDMSNDKRFEFRLPGPVRRELSELSGQTGLSAADLVRLGVSKLLQDRAALPRLPGSVSSSGLAIGRSAAVGNGQRKPRL
jgi:hypothetical protein